MDKDFLSDVTLDFLDEQDDLRDVQNDEQFRFLQLQRRLDNMPEQNRRLSTLIKSVQCNI